jgi:hypothetical protein
MLSPAPSQLQVRMAAAALQVEPTMQRTMQPDSYHSDGSEEVGPAPSNLPLRIPPSLIPADPRVPLPMGLAALLASGGQQSRMRTSQEMPPLLLPRAGLASSLMQVLQDT